MEITKDFRGEVLEGISVQKSFGKHFRRFATSPSSTGASLVPPHLGCQCSWNRQIHRSWNKWCELHWHFVANSFVGDSWTSKCGTQIRVLKFSNPLSAHLISLYYIISSSEALYVPTRHYWSGSSTRFLIFTKPQYNNSCSKSLQHHHCNSRNAHNSRNSPNANNYAANNNTIEVPRQLYQYMYIRTKVLCNDMKALMIQCKNSTHYLHKTNQTHVPQRANAILCP